MQIVLLGLILAFLIEFIIFFAATGEWNAWFKFISKVMRGE